MKIGDLSRQSLAEIWNGAELKQIRRNMLAGQADPHCSRCYEQDAMGFRSLRRTSNTGLAHHWPIVGETESDGNVARVNISYLDIRFSNICNFRCRTCGTELSSGWYEDAVKLGQTPIKKIIQVKSDMNEFWQELEPYLSQIESVYFAGGEPLFTIEHYKILEKLIELNKTNVVINYNTNFSELRFKHYDLLELWSHFENVGVDASLDAMGPRAEYLRKGTVWSKIESNRRRMQQDAPHVRFGVNCTLSVFNAFHMPDFHRSWVEQGLIGINSWNINTLFFQRMHRVQVLPAELKDLLQAKYDSFISEFLVPNGANESTIQSYTGVIRFAKEKDLSSLLPEFFKLTDRVDAIRDESFAEVFSEYRGLRSYVA